MKSVVNISCFTLKVQRACQVLGSQVFDSRKISGRILDSQTYSILSITSRLSLYASVSVGKKDKERETEKESQRETIMEEETESSKESRGAGL